MKKSLRIMLAVTAMFCLLSVSQSAEALSIVSSFDDGYVGYEYSSSVYVQGGEEPYYWSLVDGDLPYGIDDFREGNMDEILVLEGTPTTAGRYTFTIEAEDMAGETVSKSFTITIDDDNDDDNDRSSFNGGSGSGGSGGGCNTGLACLGLMLVAGLAFKKSR